MRHLCARLCFFPRSFSFYVPVESTFGMALTVGTLVYYGSNKKPRYRKNCTTQSALKRNGTRRVSFTSRPVTATTVAFAQREQIQGKIFPSDFHTGVLSFDHRIPSANSRFSSTPPRIRCESECKLQKVRMLIYERSVWLFLQILGAFSSQLIFSW